MSRTRSTPIFVSPRHGANRVAPGQGDKQSRFCQDPFGVEDHDSLQYHFRCGALLGAVRLFRTPTLASASLWVWKEGALLELHNSRSRIHQTSEHNLAVSDGSLRLSQDGEVVRITLGERLLIELEPKRTLRWSDTISTVIHQPDIACRLVFDGESHGGVGYCKRYSWTPAPHYWGYHFVQGWSDDGIALWTADATFGTKRYSYFCLLEPDGRLLTGDPERIRHWQDVVLCDLPEGEVRVCLRELAVWETPLISNRMDSLLRQRLCAFNVEKGGCERQGLAIHETCFGTLG